MSATWGVRIRALGAALALALILDGASCGGRPPRTVTRVWWVGRAAPAFDPSGPQDAVRWSLERLVSRGLVEEGATGNVVPAAAERITASHDSLVYTFHLRRGLRYTNGAPCRSADFAAALEDGLRRADHGTAAWALAAVRGVELVRGGHPLPPLGIRAADDSTLVLELSRRDPGLLGRLALPGLCTAWARRDSAADWKSAVGLGPYRVLHEEPRRLVLVCARRPARPAGPSLPDTVSVRFEPVVGRLRAALRSGHVDLLWPVPGAMLAEPLPESYRHASAPASPLRRLLLVMRADVPPTTKLAARRALAHGLNRSEVTSLLGAGARDPVSWWPDAAPFEYPKLDAGEVAAWLDRGRLGRSFHAVMLIDGEGVGAAVARSLQGEWARLNLSVDLLALRGAALKDEALQGWRAQLALVEWQALTADPAAELAGLVLPPRGPAVGPLRTGWRTREFDPWIRPGRPKAPLDLDAVQRRLAEQLVALPLAEIDWTWIERSGVQETPAHPHFGPEIAPLDAAGGGLR